MRALFSLGVASAALVVVTSVSIYGCTSGVSSTTGDGGFGSSGGGGEGGSDGASDAPNVSDARFEASSGDSGVACGTLGGMYSKKCTTVSDCTTVARGCYCGAQPVIGIAKSGAAAASACEQKAADDCALGCANMPGRTAEDGQNDIDGGSIEVRCDNAECHTVLQ